jgi:hypothetical protein
MEKNLELLAREEARIYQREWRAENKDRVRKYNTEYWMRRAAKKLTEQKKEG